MAKKQKTNPTNLMAYDFLPKTTGGNMSGLYGQLAQLGAVQRSQPLVNQAITQSFLNPVTTYINKAQEQVVAGMIQYNEANPDLDESQLFDGTEDSITLELKNNNARFKELNKQLGFMSPANPRYEETVAEMNRINKSNVTLRDQNKKLLDIKNMIRESDISAISQGNSSVYLNLYKDIQEGKKDNFSIKEGRIIYTNKDEKGELKTIEIDALDASGPEMTLGAAFDAEYKTRNKIRQIPNSILTDQDLSAEVNIMARAIGNKGLKSLIWDSQNGGESMSADGTMFNTEPWIQQYIKSAGKEVTPDIVDMLKSKGVMYTLPGANKNMKDSFLDWYKEKVKTAPKYGKGAPPPPDSSSNYMIDKQTVPVSAVQPTVDLLNQNFENLGPQTSWNGVTWRVVDGQYQFFNTNENKFQDIDKNILVARGFKFGPQHGVEIQTTPSSTTKSIDIEGGDVKNKYGFGFGAQSISPNSILSTLQNMPVLGNVNTKEDIERILEFVKKNPSAQARIIDQINSDNNTKIKNRHLEEMLETLINRIQ